MRIDDAMLMAYADGELDPAARAEVEAAIAADPALQARVAAHRELRAMVSGAYAGVADEPVPDRLAAMLRPTAEVVDFAAAKARRETPAAAPRRWPQWTAIAATLVVGVLAGRMIDLGPSASIIARDGTLVAQGELARTLDTQLAGGEVGLSFRNREGDHCRTFNADGLAGVACRDGDRWGVQMALATAPAAAGDYRMAGSDTPPEVLRAVEAMIDGEPLDAAAEAAARAQGWRD